MNSEINDGGPAFPTIMPGFAKEGMSLRAYIATQAMHAIMTNCVEESARRILEKMCVENETLPSKQIAKMAAEQADALINELNKPVTQTKP